MFAFEHWLDFENPWLEQHDLSHILPATLDRILEDSKPLHSHIRLSKVFLRLESINVSMVWSWPYYKLRLSLNSQTDCSTKGIRPAFWLLTEICMPLPRFRLTDVCHDPETWNFVTLIPRTSCLTCSTPDKQSKQWVSNVEAEYYDCYLWFNLTIIGRKLQLKS